MNQSPLDQKSAVVILILGASSTGKSAVGLELHRILSRPSIFISGDSLKQPETSPAQQRLRSLNREAKYDVIRAFDRAYYAALHAFQREGIYAIGEVGIFNHPRRDVLIQEFRKIPSYLIRLTSSNSVRLARAGSRGEEWRRHSRYTAENEVTDLPFALTIDTSSITPEEAARQITDLLAPLAPTKREESITREAAVQLAAAPDLRRVSRKSVMPTSNERKVSMGTYDFADDGTAKKLTSGVLDSMEGGGIEVTDRDLKVTMGDPPIFSAIIPRSSIRSAKRVPVLSGPTRGAHGRRGRWLVNRSGTNLVRLDIRPPADAELKPPSVVKNIKNRGKIVKFLIRERGIKLRELTISASQPDDLVRELGF